MYICNCHELKLKGGRIVKRGDPVPEADTWPENIRRSNLSMGYIILKPADSKAASGGHPNPVRVSTTIALPLEPLSSEQALRKAKAPVWLVKEAEKGRVLQPDRSTVVSTPQGGITLEAGQGPSATTVPEAEPAIDESDARQQERQQRKRGRR